MGGFSIQCGPPPVMFVGLDSPQLLVRYKYGTINHSYWSYVHQLNYRTGASHCMFVYHFGYIIRRFQDHRIQKNFDDFEPWSCKVEAMVR